MTKLRLDCVVILYCALLVEGQACYPNEDCLDGLEDAAGVSLLQKRAAMESRVVHGQPPKRVKSFVSEGSRLHSRKVRTMARMHVNESLAKEGMQNWDLDAIMKSGGDQIQKVTIYGESLCPGCSDWFVNILDPLLKLPDFFNKVDLQYIPWGNAENLQPRMSCMDALQKREIACQHGPVECFGNRIYGCFKSAAKSKSAVYMPFINCAENYISSIFADETLNIQSMDQFVSIFEQKGSWESITNQHCAGFIPESLKSEVLQCATTASQIGDKIECENAMLTDSLVPPHQWTPWITINGVASKEAAEVGNAMDFLKVVYPDHVTVTPAPQQIPGCSPSAPC